MNEKLSIFKDADEIADYAKACVATAVEYGIVKGTYDDGSLKFKPEDYTNRAEAAVIIYRMLDDVPAVDFSDFESFIAHIKTTDGFKLANKSVPKDINGHERILYIDKI